MFQSPRGRRHRYFNFAESEMIEAFDRWQRTHLKQTARWQREERIKRATEEAAKLKNRKEWEIWFATSATSKVFYASSRWRQLRFQAIQKYGRKCISCGRTPDHGAVIHVDHIKPRVIWPELAFDINNLQILCSECNFGKRLHKTKVIRRPFQK